MKKDIQGMKKALSCALNDPWDKTYTNQPLALTVKRCERTLQGAQAALMLDSGRYNLQANTDKIQHLL